MAGPLVIIVCSWYLPTRLCWEINGLHVSVSGLNLPCNGIVKQSLNVN